MFQNNTLYNSRALSLSGLVFSAILATTGPAKSQDVARSSLPVLFDAKERLVGADLSTLPRIRFLTAVDFPPFNFTDQENRLAGVHVDLIREICAELKIETKCQIQALPFDELEGALELGEGEVVVSGIASTGTLRRNYAFSRPFFRMPARFAVKKNSGLTGLAAKALKGKKVGVIKDSRYEDMLRAFMPDVTVVSQPDRKAIQDALKNGSVDAIFGDGLRLPFWVNGTESSDCCVLFDEPYFSDRHLGEGFTIMAVDQNNQLIPAFDHALAVLSRNGRLEEIYRRYFPHGFY